MWYSGDWQDYELMDAADGERLERWGNFVLIRPDPQAAWGGRSGNPLWGRAHGRYHRSSSGGGQWEFYKSVPESWTIRQGAYRFKIKPMNFKHMGLFPEQLVNWQWADGLIRAAGRPVQVLNLFAYTGGATVAASGAGAAVCHVDASRGIVAHARENAALSGLAERPVRWLVDDCFKFVQREIRRGRTYDGIIMDPPSYGRGPGGEVWKIETDLYAFLEACVQVLSSRPLFVLLNSYTTGLSAATMGNLLALTVKQRFGGAVTADEIGISMTDKGLVLPCGSSARWVMT